MHGRANLRHFKPPRHALACPCVQEWDHVAQEFRPRAAPGDGEEDAPAVLPEQPGPRLPLSSFLNEDGEAVFPDAWRFGDPEPELTREEEDELVRVAEGLKAEGNTSYRYVCALLEYELPFWHNRHRRPSTLSAGAGMATWRTRFPSTRGPCRGARRPGENALCISGIARRPSWRRGITRAPSRTAPMHWRWIRATCERWRAGGRASRGGC